MLKLIARFILRKEIVLFTNEFNKLKNHILKINKHSELENTLNNKYPKSDITYRRTESDGLYHLDLRLFINQNDYKLPVIEGESDDEKALNGLAWVIKNITYISDKTLYNLNEYWAMAYQTLKHKKGDCEDGAILLYNILLKSGIPYWKLRLSAGYVRVGNKKEGHCWLSYYCEAQDKWVILDWCYWPNLKLIEERENYKDETKYLDVWFSWNKKYCFTKGLNTQAKKLLK